VFDQEKGGAYCIPTLPQASVVSFGHIKEDRDENKVLNVVSLQDDVGVNLGVKLEDGRDSVVKLADGTLVLFEVDVGSGSGIHTGVQVESQEREPVPLTHG